MALTPLPSGIGQGSNPRPYVREPTTLLLDHSFRFLYHFWPYLMWASNFWAPPPLLEINSSLKITKNRHIKLVQIPDTHCTIGSSNGSSRTRDGPLSLSPKIISISPFISLTSENGRISVIRNYNFPLSKVIIWRNHFYTPLKMTHKRGCLKDI